MKYQNTRRGFTLIELLVVVLIISILVAVALPQYKIAVAKSKISQLLPVINAMKKSYELYYEETGKYPDDISMLTISLPSSCNLESNGMSTYIQCGTNVLIDAQKSTNSGDGVISVSFCPKYNKNYTQCAPKRDLGIVFNTSRPNRTADANVRIPNKAVCVPFTNFGQSLCNSLLGGAVDQIVKK
ncbi:MAG: pilin [Elusimicrobiaceae bacterium]|nr:pilin [Elusimicrobiaceae bacterium]